MQSERNSHSKIRDEIKKKINDIQVLIQRERIVNRRMILALYIVVIVQVSDTYVYNV